MDSHSRSASPREQPRPQQRPPSPPSPRLPPAGFDNRAYQHDDADPNHNESFTSNGAQQNGHNKELNGESKSHEAVNLELINLTPKNGSLKQKKDVEVDMNGSNPYDEYFVPVNEHRKYMRGEKLYVTADKRGEKGGCKRPLCWTLLALVVAAIIALIALAATGVIFSNSPTPVDPYNVSISSARALGNIGQSHESQDHSNEQHDISHDNSIDQNHEQHNHVNDQNLENHDQNNEQNADHEQHNHENDPNHEQDDQSSEQGQEKPSQNPNEDENENTQKLPHHIQDHEQNENTDNQNQNGQDHQQHEDGQDQNLDWNHEASIPETQNDAHAVVPEADDMSMYVPRTIEGELKIDNVQFLDAYNDPESEEYRQFTDSFKDALMRVIFDGNTLQSGDNDIKLEVIQLRPGSVIVTYRINWEPKYDNKPIEDLLNATMLEAKLNNYLNNNNKMISVYHIAGDNLVTKRVLDLCQIRKNDCQEGCEFDKTSLEFACTCPQGFILDMNRPKTCVPYTFYPDLKPSQETSSVTPVTTTAKAVNSQVTENSSGFYLKDIQAESATEAESDLKFSNTFHEHVNNSWDLEPTIEHKPEMNESPESFTKQTPDMNFSVVPETGISQSQSTTDMFDLPTKTQNNTIDSMFAKDNLNVSINENVTTKTETNINVTEEPKTSTLEESNTGIMEEPKTDTTEEPEVGIIEEPKTDTNEEPKTYTMAEPKTETIEEPKSETAEETNTDEEFGQENLSESHMSQQPQSNSMNSTLHQNYFKPSEYETAPSSNDSEPELDLSHYPDSAFNIETLLGSHQFIKPEEVYTEQPEPTPSEQNDLRDTPHSTFEPDDTPKSNETLLLPNSSISLTNLAISQPEPMEWNSNKNIVTNTSVTTTVSPTTNILQLDVNTIQSQSPELRPEILPHEKDVIMNSSELYLNAHNNKTETTTDDIDDWLADTLPNDNKTSNVNKDSHVFYNPETSFLIPTDTVSENNSDSKSLNIKSNEQIPPNHNDLDMNALLGLLGKDSNATQYKETEDNNSNPAFRIDDLENGRSFSDNKDFRDFIEDNRNETNVNYGKKVDDYDLPSITSESRVPISQETNTNQQDFTSESPETSSSISNHVPQDILNSMKSLNEPEINKTITNITTSDDAKYITFDDINMLWNRSSKSMDNLTQNVDNREQNESSENKTFDLRAKQNDSEWISEPVTEINYNEKPNKEEQTETAESIKNKVNQIMSHAKDDYEPDYLNKADDSMYMLERDYEIEDPRVKRVNSETKDISTEKNIEANAISNVSSTLSNEPTSTNTHSVLPNYGYINETTTSTTSPRSTTVTDYIFNAVTKNINDINETSTDTSMLLNTPQTQFIPEIVSVIKQIDNTSTSEPKIFKTDEINPGEVLDTTTPIMFSTQSEINKTFSNTSVYDNNYNQNETQLNNLDVTIYEISHNSANHSLPISNSTNNQMSEYDDHETEMNPFLPEAENNKNLVKKLQEGHDFELTNMNETQNENNDEHTFNNTDTQMIINNETSTPVHLNELFNETAPNTIQYVNEQTNVTTAVSSPPLSTVENVDKNNPLDFVTPKVLPEDKRIEENIASEQEVLPISTFLIDTDDLDARNKVRNSLSTLKDTSLTKFTDSGDDNLSVVPITGEAAENIPEKNAKIHSSYELNAISDTSKNSEKRTFELANFDPVTNNES